jgi:hypothetical protein
MISMCFIYQAECQFQYYYVTSPNLFPNKIVLIAPTPDFKALSLLPQRCFNSVQLSIPSLAFPKFLDVISPIKEKITNYGVSPIGKPNWAAWLLKVCLSPTGFPGVWPSVTGTSNSTPETWHGPSSSQK